MDIINLRVAFKGETLCPEHWIYIPDPGTYFYRVGFPSNVNAKTCPPGTSSLSIEYRTPRINEIRINPERLAQEAIRYLEGLGMIRVEKLLFCDEIKISPAYVLNRSTGRQEFQDLFAYLEERSIFSVGRYGRWDYFSMEGSFKQTTPKSHRISLNTTDGVALGNFQASQF